MFIAYCKRTRIGRIKSGILALVAVSCFFLLHFFAAALVFSGRPLLGYDVLSRFRCLAQSCAPFFSTRCRLVVFCPDFIMFAVPWTSFLGIGRPIVLVLCFVDQQGHTFVPAGAANSAANKVTKLVRPPSVVGFRTVF